MNTTASFFAGSEPEVAGHAAAIIISEAWRAVASRGRFTFVLSGGRSPRMLYRKLAAGVEAQLMRLHDIPVPACPEPVYAERVQEDLIRMPWHKTLVFWGDERCVPPDHPDSNYLMAKETLLDASGIAPDHIFRMPCNGANPEETAKAYEETIRTVSGCRDTGTFRKTPVFDLMVLGLGEDGHTASLFPDDPETLNEPQRLVVAVKAPQANPRVPRLTLTLPLINHSETILFFTAGEKRAVLAEAIRAGKAPSSLPAGMVKPRSGRLFWFISLP
ncbi:MAG: 6-phosphogluconolactonase [Chlorobium sp.]|uniref:6-phosphogluconolactonase n=1 Tax=Chlorobium sp. TaxID=1095 RepID=UPI0025BF3C3D|nr:6-phosphogluconolactonase [Chlorobium sp.]MCF8382967.1 6-phosphogluconolactonase [Chlorobium sp.]